MKTLREALSKFHGNKTQFFCVLPISVKFYAYLYLIIFESIAYFSCKKSKQALKPLI
jgi:hypothetical protein